MAVGERTTKVGGDELGSDVGNGKGVGGRVGRVGYSLFELGVVTLHAVRRLTNNKKMTAYFAFMKFS
jgi:hypothetical protein